MGVIYNEEGQDSRSHILLRVGRQKSHHQQPRARRYAPVLRPGGGTTMPVSTRQTVHVGHTGNHGQACLCHGRNTQVFVSWPLTKLTRADTILYTEKRYRGPGTSPPLGRRDSLACRRASQAWSRWDLTLHDRSKSHVANLIARQVVSRFAVSFHRPATKNATRADWAHRLELPAASTPDQPPVSPPVPVLPVCTLSDQVLSHGCRRVLDHHGDFRRRGSGG
ncbi:hypothetical protein GE09DRAFT_144660 [Coniochaeta sp. 2T2.1]|nr:hypothetical protein GE09DRAFT_144660 [Coniochaeta sp. 2T2.1]